MSGKEAVDAFKAAKRAKARQERLPYLAVAGISAFAVVAAIVLFPAHACGCIGPEGVNASNMRQLSLALAQYAEDNTDTYPSATSPNGKGWREAIYPYVKSVYPYSRSHESFGQHNTADNLPRAFAVNHIGPDAHGNERGVFAVAGEKPVTLSQLTEANDVIVLTSVSRVDGEYWNITNPSFLPQTGLELYVDRPVHPFYQHTQGYVMFAFLDGHVKPVPKPTVTLAPYNLWTRDNAPFVGQDLTNARAILTHAEEK